MKTLDFILLFFTMLAGILCFVFTEALLNNYNGVISSIILMGIYFAMAGLIITVITNICVYKISPIKHIIPVPNAFLKSISCFSLLAVILLFSLGCLFQYIYELGIVNNSRRTDNYIVVVDNSGSMNVTDENFERYEALEYLFTTINPKQTLGVYVFSDNYANVFKSKKVEKIDIENFSENFSEFMISDGGTEIMKVLDAISLDLEKNKLPGKTEVFVISDGECTIDNTILNKFVDLNVPVSTIGVSNTDSLSTLYEISETTGGIYYDIDNIEQLSNVLKGINSFRINHLLTGYRDNAYNSSYYMLIRILFLFLLSFSIKIIQLLTIDIGTVRKIIFFECILFSLLSAFLTEHLLQNIIITEPKAHIIMLFLISLLIVPVKIFKQNIIGLGGVTTSNEFYSNNKSKKENENHGKSLKKF